MTPAVQDEAADETWSKAVLHLLEPANVSFARTVAVALIPIATIRPSVVSKSASTSAPGCSR